MTEDETSATVEGFLSAELEAGEYTVTRFGHQRRVTFQAREDAPGVRRFMRRGLRFDLGLPDYGGSVKVVDFYKTWSPTKGMIVKITVEHPYDYL